LQRLTVLRKNHADEQYLARRSVRDLPETIASLSQRLSQLTGDRDTALAHADDAIMMSGRHCSREEAIHLLGGKLDSLPMFVSQMQRFPLGVYRGLRFGLVLQPQSAPDIYLEGAMIRQSMLSRDHHGPRAVLNAVERLAGAYDSECARVMQDLRIAEAQLRDHQARLGMQFDHESYLSRLTALRDQLKLGLSDKASERNAEPLPSVSDLTEQIKALTAAHTIEAAPQRMGKSRGSAEEPVTARIRRKMEAMLATVPSIKSDTAEV
jgi:hypothetical protein